MKKTALLLILAFLLPQYSLGATPIDDGEQTIGGVIWGNVGEAVRAAGEAKSELSLASNDIQVARDAYYRALVTGTNVENAQDQFFQLLLMKDFYHLMTTIPEGPQGTVKRFTDMLATVDGGIAPAAKPEFFDWVAAIRLALGAKRDNDYVVLWPNRIPYILQKTQNRAQRYFLARNRSELFNSGIPLSKLYTPESYAKELLVELSSRERVDVEFEVDDPQQSASEWYGMLVETLGKQTVDNAAKKVLQVQRTAAGTLKESISVLDPQSGITQQTNNAEEAFLSKLWTSPKGYVLWLHMTSLTTTPSWGDRLKSAATYYSEIQNKYSEARVAEASKTIMDAPKHPMSTPVGGGTLVDFSGKGGYTAKWWLDAILADPNVQLPTDTNVVEAAAASSSDIDKAVESKGFDYIYGRVAAIETPRNQKMSEAISIIYFEGAKDFIAVVDLGGDTFIRKNLVLPGNLVKISGVVKEGSFRAAPFARYARIWETSIEDNVEILDEGKWPAKFKFPDRTGNIVFEVNEERAGTVREAARIELERQKNIKEVMLEVPPKPKKQVTPLWPSDYRPEFYGWVELSFRIDEYGKIGWIELLEAEPWYGGHSPNVRAAYVALGQWEYEPILVDGVAVRALRNCARFWFDPTKSKEPTVELKKCVW